MDKWFDTLTHIMNNIADRLERIELNQVVITQWQPHTELEKVKEGEESLFFDSPSHILTGLLAYNPECDGDLEPFLWQLENNLQIVNLHPSMWNMALAKYTQGSKITSYWEPARKVIKRIDNILQQMTEQPSEAQKIATPEAIHVEGLDTDDDDNVEDNYEDKVEPPITAPILLNHQHATAFIDSGASHSFISPAAAERYLHPTSCKCHHTIISNIDDMEITLGDRSTTRITCHAAHIHIDCGSHKLFHHFFIMSLQGEHEILFGRDIMQCISVEFKEDDSNISDKDKCVELPPPPDTAQKITEGIHDVLQCNQQVPHGPSSSLPESIIYLNTSDAKPVFCKQYIIPEIYHNSVF
ncbi:hypothetical protein QOT17_021955 [Balamuthia mandrillaris]